MRSSKNRSRNKNNRNRSVGNVVNRVFDSSGPEGKVRGTPQQIIDKYSQLARDAQLSNDRVAAENFQQHAEHYTRMLGEATREQEARREAHEAQQNRNRQQREGGGEQGQQPAQAAVDPGSMPQPDTGSGIVEVPEASGLVETPESAQQEKPAKSRRPRRPRNQPRAESDNPSAPEAPSQEVAE